MGLVEGVKDSVRVENEGGNVIAKSNFANDGNNSQISNLKPVKYSLVNVGQLKNSHFNMTLSILYLSIW